MRTIFMSTTGIAASILLAAPAAAAEPSFGFTRANGVSANGAALEVSWNGNGKAAQGEIRFSEDAEVANYRVTNELRFCTRAEGDRVGVACNSQVQGLQPGRTYYFRTAVKWRSADGERVSLGPVASFTTQSAEQRNPPTVSYQKLTGFTDRWAEFNYLVEGNNRAYRTWVRCEAAGAPTGVSREQSHGPYIGLTNYYVRVEGLRPDTAYTCTLTAESDHGVGTAQIGVKTDD